MKVIVAVALLIATGCTRDPAYGDKSGEEWIRLLSSGQPEQQVKAANALRIILEMRPGYSKGVKALSFAIGDTSDAVRLAAANALAVEGVDGLAALPGFHAALHDSTHWAVRAATADLIGRLGPHRGLPLIPSLLEITCDSVVEVRHAAVKALRLLNADNRNIEGCTSP